MVDIARQTVEFLYEENGGIPLYLPTIEDIKDEANKFTIDKVRKGAQHTNPTLKCPSNPKHRALHTRCVNFYTALHSKHRCIIQVDMPCHINMNFNTHLYRIHVGSSWNVNTT